MKHPILTLAVDTATLTQSVAICSADELLAEQVLKQPRGHSKALLQVAHTLLESLGLTMKAVEVYAVGLGPGSFTGLRIGLALMKGLAIAHQRPLYGFSSLEAMASHFAASNMAVCPCIDARKQEVYTGCYDASSLGAPTAILQEQVVAPQLLIQALDPERPVIMTGTGAKLYREGFAAALPKAQFAPSDKSYPRAAYHAHRAAQAMASGVAPPELVGLEPRYIRPSEAELG